jgi:hypothetical protein
LGYLQALLKIAEENPGNLLILIPWVVIRELDGLKVKKIDVKYAMFTHFNRVSLKVQLTKKIYQFYQERP